MGREEKHLTPKVIVLLGIAFCKSKWKRQKINFPEERRW